MSNLEKKPTLQEWFAILAFLGNQIKSFFGSREWKGRLAKKLEARIIALEAQIKILSEGFEATSNINTLQQEEIEALKAEVALLKSNVEPVPTEEVKTSKKRATAKTEA
jgi:hypothetical protein